MGRKRPVISSVTETAAGDESPDESERPPPIIMAEESPFKTNEKKTKPKTPETDPPTARTSKRTRKPITHYDDEEFFNEFRAKNKRRRVKQEIDEPEGEEDNQEQDKQVSHSESRDEDTVDDIPTTSKKAADIKKPPRNSIQKEAVTSTPSASTIKRNSAKLITPKNEIVEEPDIIPLEHSPPQLQRESISPQFDLSSLYASASSQEKFRKAAASTNNYFLNPNLQKYPRPSDTPPHPRVILPRTVNIRAPATSKFLNHSQNYSLEQPPSVSNPIYTPRGQYHASASSSLLPQYQDKRVRTFHENEAAVKCPDCNLILKNMFAYTTHRNYVHGQAARARIACPEHGCLVMSTSMVGLVRHLNSEHRYCLRHEQRIFKNENEYMDWFRNLVEDGSVSFVRSSGGLQSNDRVSGTVSLMFYCNRSGRKHLNNRVGSLKINAVCPAYFRMTKHQSGYVSVYAQLRHIGHECIPKYKSIESFAPIRSAVNDIELCLQSFKELSKSIIPFEYPMDKNSLVSSCLELLNNVKVDFQRAKLLIDGIIPSEQVEDEAFPAYDDELFKSAADVDIFALPYPKDSATTKNLTSRKSPVLRFESSPELDDEVQILKQSIYNAAANLENTSVAQISPPPGDTPSPPAVLSDLGSTSSKSGKLDTVRNMDEERIKQYRQTPIILENGRIQCTLCSVILKTFDSYNVHRHTQHGLQKIKSTQSKWFG